MTAADNFARSLQQFELQNVYTVTEGNGQAKLLGSGPSTSVIEFKYNELKCAGKKIHDWVITDQIHDANKSILVRRFKEECEFLSQVRHPNIVQFLGVYFQKGEQLPILVMEFLPTNLTSCIKKDDIPPKEISYSILHDVALGLYYLHSQTPPIIHRNLNSNNVLLTPNMTAKISDLGVAKILKGIQEDSEMTRNPGDVSFMPPEAMLPNPKYNTCIDEFSYGIVMIHVFSGRWPAPQVEPIHYEPDGTRTIMSEADRRKVFLQAIGNDHPLMDLILKCIHNLSDARAHASEIVKRLAGMVLQFPASFANRLEMLKQIEADEKKNAAKISLLEEEHTNEVQKLQSQIMLLKKTHENEVMELKSKMAQCVDSMRLERQLDSATGQDDPQCHKKERSTAASSSDRLPGVDVAAETTVFVTNNQQNFAWEDYGLRLHIPKDSLPTGIEQCTIKIMVSLAGQYEFPDNSHPVTAVYWLRCEPSCKFAKPVSLEIQHCAKQENVSKLNFVRAVCSQKSLPYTFRQLAAGACFTSSSSNGVIELDSFSGVAGVQEGSQDKEYIARLFYLNPNVSSCEIHLVVTWNLKAHFTSVEEEYCQRKRVLPGPDQPVEFESDQIRLDIPDGGIVVSEGWRLIPLIPPVVTKRHLDGYLPGKRIPRCQLSAEFKPVSAEDKPIPALEYQVKLIGAKKPHNMFSIKPPAPETYQQLAHSTSDERERINTASGDSPGYSHQQPHSSSGPEIPTLKDAINMLRNKVTWEDIGIQLDIDIGELEKIKSDYGSDCNACVREMLKFWIRCINPPPSWSNLVDALEAVGDESTASQIRAKYIV